MERKVACYVVQGERACVALQFEYRPSSDLMHIHAQYSPPQYYYSKTYHSTCIIVLLKKITFHKCILGFGWWSLSFADPEQKKLLVLYQTASRAYFLVWIILSNTFFSLHTFWVKFPRKCLISSQKCLEFPEFKNCPLGNEFRFPSYR